MTQIPHNDEMPRSYRCHTDTVEIRVHVDIHLHLGITLRSARRCASTCFHAACNICTFSVPPRTLLASLPNVRTSHSPICRASLLGDIVSLLLEALHLMAIVPLLVKAMLLELMSSDVAALDLFAGKRSCPFPFCGLSGCPKGACP